MLAELVLVTRLLGLVRGEYPVDIDVDPRVRRVELLRDGEMIRTLTGPPWQALIDFGPEITPQELSAVAYDESGRVIGRDTQLVNLPRPAAEAAIDLQREADSLRATVRWKHIGSARVRDIQWRLDGRSIGSEASILLPPFSAGNLHVLDVEVTFWDAVTARKERVFGGLYAEEVPAELTAALVHLREGGIAAGACFRSAGAPVAAAAVERGEAMVLFVRDPDPRIARRALRGAHARRLRLDARARIMWPTAVAVVDAGRRAVANLFEHSQVLEGEQGTHALLTAKTSIRKNDHRYADAVAVSAAYAAVGARRRVVVLVIGSEKDRSRQEPAVVRRYLERIGVPLRVWSLVGPKRELVDLWGEVTDVSSASRLQKATDELRAELERQRIAWLPLPPLEALRIEAGEGCALVPVARPSSRRDGEP